MREKADFGGVESLTEQQIAKAALGFLHRHYRYRPRESEQFLLERSTDETIADYRSSWDDMSTQVGLVDREGVIVDGELSFPMQDGYRFTATVEATSRATRGEVVFELQQRLLFWDGMAVASLLTALGFAYAATRVALLDVGWLLIFLFLLLGLAGFGLLFRLLARSARRYHYIYAVEQFKQYRADEQWVAIGEDVFPSREDRAFRELSEQCIFNGLGLLIVHADRSVETLFTPSRVDTFGGKRRIRQFLATNRFAKKARLERLSGAMAKAGARLRQRVKLPSGSLLRYRKTYWKQALLTGFGLSLIGLVLWRTYQARPVVRIGDDRYRERLRTVDLRPEPELYLLDSSRLEEPLFGDDPVTSEPEDEWDDEQLVEISPLREKGGSATPTLVYFTADTDGYRAYDCARLYNFESTKYVIRTELVDSYPEALERLRYYRRNALDATAIWLDCFAAGQPRYLIFLQSIYNSKQEAMDAAQDLNLVPDGVIERELVRVVPLRTER